MLRGLQLLRTRYLEPNPGLLAQTLAAIEEAGERQAVHSILSGRRLAYVGAIGGAAVAATAATAAMIVHRARRRTMLPRRLTTCSPLASASGLAEPTLLS